MLKCKIKSKDDLLNKIKYLSKDPHAFWGAQVRRERFKTSKDTILIAVWIKRTKKSTI